MTVGYEWDVELVEQYEDGENDIHEHYHQATYADCVKKSEEQLESGLRWDVVLVCDDDNGRSWAYVKDGKLPTHFEDAYGAQVRKVPQRFHAEIVKV